MTVAVLLGAAAEARATTASPESWRSHGSDETDSADQQQQRQQQQQQAGPRGVKRLSDSEQQALGVLQALLPSTNADTVRDQLIRCLSVDSIKAHDDADSMDEEAPESASASGSSTTTTTTNNTLTSRPHKMARAESSCDSVSTSASAPLKPRATNRKNSRGYSTAWRRKSNCHYCEPLGQNCGLVAGKCPNRPCNSCNQRHRLGRCRKTSSKQSKRRASSPQKTASAADADVLRNVKTEAAAGPAVSAAQSPIQALLSVKPEETSRLEAAAAEALIFGCAGKNAKLFPEQASSAATAPVNAATAKLLELARSSSSPVPSSSTENRAGDSDVDFSRPASSSPSASAATAPSLQNVISGSGTAPFTLRASRPAAIDTSSDGSSSSSSNNSSSSSNPFSLFSSFQPMMAQLRASLPQQFAQPRQLHLSQFHQLQHMQQQQPPSMHASVESAKELLQRQPHLATFREAAPPSAAMTNFWAASAPSLRTPTSLATNASSTAAATAAISPKSSRNARRASRGDDGDDRGDIVDAPAHKSAAASKPTAASKAAGSADTVPRKQPLASASSHPQAQQRQYTMMRKRSECHFCKQIGQNCGRVAGKCPNRPCSDCGGRHRHGRCRLKRMARVFANN